MDIIKYYCQILLPKKLKKNETVMSIKISINAGDSL